MHYAVCFIAIKPFVFVDDLTDTDLRKVRILYNMLRTASLEPASHVADAEDPTKTDGKTKDLGKTKSVEKVKGARRHVVFVGNLPHDVTKQKVCHRQSTRFFRVPNGNIWSVGHLLQNLFVDVLLS